MATKTSTTDKTGKMTQAQIITALADKCDLNKKVVKDLLEAMTELAVKETKRSGVFVVPGLGRLVKSERKARIGRNPATGEQIKIPARKVVKFKIAKATQDQIVPPKKK
jgi:DNA-binding protein HU-beta